MRIWAMVFGGLSVIAGALGFAGLVGAESGLAKVLFFLFGVLAAAFLLLGLTVFKKAE
jgi:uncharacterized membrane protein YtjA (UPF0391 family)